MTNNGTTFPRLNEKSKSSNNWLYTTQPSGARKFCLPPGPKAMWGTQDMLSPPSQAALNAEPSPRVEELSAPKKSFHENPNRSFYFYSTGRESQLGLVSEAAKSGIVTMRLNELAKHKELHQEHINSQQNRPSYFYSAGRESPIWTVAEAAKAAGERPHTTHLAKAKDAHPQFQPERQVQSAVTPNARQARCSERVQQLATPRMRVVTMFRDPQWQVGDRFRKVHASGRIIELARSKNLADGYGHNYDLGAGYERVPKLIREVTSNARRATASNRTSELSLPIVRSSMDKVQFDPTAFTVKPAALKAWCSSRLTELAEPLKR